MHVQGFTAAAVAAGIRYTGRSDLGLIFSEVPAVAAGVLTTNRVKAAPVRLSMERLRTGRAQAILVNSGNANACTGVPGMEAARATSAMAAQALGIEEELVQLASTGVIGLPLPVDSFARAMPELVGNLSASKLDDVAQAIMTTDLVEKTAAQRIVINNTPVSLFGMAKGSGMIRPDMATMLCFVVTDAQIVFPVLDKLLREAVDESFNAITVDGDTSTNDMVLVLANGMANNAWIDEDNAEGVRIFGTALREICQELALKIVADGEGATKLVRIEVKGARTRAEAINAGQTIANSALVKTAFSVKMPTGAGSWLPLAVRIAIFRKIGWILPLTMYSWWSTACVWGQMPRPEPPRCSNKNASPLGSNSTKGTLTQWCTPVIFLLIMSKLMPITAAESLV